MVLRDAEGRLGHGRGGWGAIVGEGGGMWLAVQKGGGSSRCESCRGPSHDSVVLGVVMLIFWGECFSTTCAWWRCVCGWNSRTRLAR